MSQAENAKPAGYTRAQGYALVLLSLVYACHMIDRTVIVTVLEPIRHEFGLSDSQLGLLSGLAFASGYTLAGIPLSIAVDRVKRVRLLGILVAAWSSLTLVCGATSNFALLLVARFGVGAGESGGQPTVMSLVGDIVPPGRRASAVGFIHAGVPMGLLVGAIVGANVAASYGWRMALYVVGLPGILLALILVLTLREPVRGATESADAPVEETVSQREFLGFLKGRPALIHVFTGLMILWFCSCAYSAWLTSFMIRSHGMDVREAGTAMAVTGFLGGLTGNFVAGRLGDYVAKWGLHKLAMCAGFAALLHFPFSMVTMLAADKYVSLAGYLLQVICYFTVFTIGNTLAINLATSRTRGRLMALVAVGTTFLGYGIGPQVVGLLSDFYEPWTKGESLRYGLLTTMFSILWCAVHFFLASRAMRKADLPQGAIPEPAH